MQPNIIMLTEKTFDMSGQSAAIKIGVVSDTHGEIANGILQTLKGCEVILHAGDVCGQSVLDQLCEITDTVVAVGGNNDGRFAYTSSYTPTYSAQGELPDLVHIKLPGGKLSIVHGHQFGWAQPSHSGMREAFPDSKTVIYGHSHLQLHDTDAAPSLLNPGAAGHIRTNGGASCAVVSIDNAEWDVKLHRT